MDDFDDSTISTIGRSFRLVPNRACPDVAIAGRTEANLIYTLNNEQAQEAGPAAGQGARVKQEP